MKGWRPLLWFCVLTYSLVMLVMAPQLLAIRGGWSINLPAHWETLAAFSPFVAALVVVTFVDRSSMLIWRQDLFRWRAPWMWVAFSVFTPALIWLVAVILSGNEGLPNPLKLMVPAAMAELVIFGALLQALGEEPGWRGYFLARLQGRFRPLFATLLLAPLWIAWHIPAFLSRPEFGLAQFLGLSLGLLSAAFWLTLLYEKTRSVPMIILWHAFINIWRAWALAISPAVFLTFGGVVTAGALVIAIYWIVRDWRVLEPTT